MFKPVDPDSIIARHPDGAVLAVGPLKAEYPLYRNVRLVLPQNGRAKRSYWLQWIVHQARLKRGGDGWRLMQTMPDLYAWALKECTRDLTPEDAQEAHGLTAAEWAELVTAEQAKYGA
jgi:hypothetical protein